jgi:hypothetical protein
MQYLHLAFYSLTSIAYIFLPPFRHSSFTCKGTPNAFFIYGLRRFAWRLHLTVAILDRLVAAWLMQRHGKAGIRAAQAACCTAVFAPFYMHELLILNVRLTNIMDGSTKQNTGRGCRTNLAHSQVALFLMPIMPLWKIINNFPTEIYSNYKSSPFVKVMRFGSQLEQVIFYLSKLVTSGW